MEQEKFEGSVKLLDITFAKKHFCNIFENFGEIEKIEEMI